MLQAWFKSGSGAVQLRFEAVAQAERPSDAWFTRGSAMVQAWFSNFSGAALVRHSAHAGLATGTAGPASTKGRNAPGSLPPEVPAAPASMVERPRFQRNNPRAGLFARVRAPTGHYEVAARRRAGRPIAGKGCRWDRRNENGHTKWRRALAAPMQTPARRSMRKHAIPYSCNRSATAAHTKRQHTHPFVQTRGWRDAQAAGSRNPIGASRSRGGATMPSDVLHVARWPSARKETISPLRRPRSAAAAGDAAPAGAGGGRRPPRSSRLGNMNFSGSIESASGPSLVGRAATSFAAVAARLPSGTVRRSTRRSNWARAEPTSVSPPRTKKTVLMRPTRGPAFSHARAAALPRVAPVRFCSGSGVVQAWFRHASNRASRAVGAYLTPSSRVVQPWFKWVQRSPSPVQVRPGRCERADGAWHDVQVESRRSSGVVPAWFSNGSGAARLYLVHRSPHSARLSRGSGVVQAWFSHGSGSAYARSDPINCRRRVARIMVKCESAVVQAWFRCGSAMVQARPY